METITKEQLDQIQGWIRIANLNIDMLIAQSKEIARQRDEALAEVEMFRTMLGARK